MDYFINRYFSSVQGRFTSADPIPITSVRPANPQLWNLYGYVGNNPLSHIDPNGLEVFATGEEAERYRRELEKATGLKLALNQKTGQITIVEKPKKLTDDAQRIAAAIEDPNNKVQITAINDKDGKLNVAVGAFEGDGKQTIDFADIDALSKGKAITGGSASVIHETIEAYEGLANPTVRRAKTLGLGLEDQFGYAHKEATRYENIYRTNNRLPTFQGSLGAPGSNGGTTVYVEYSTHREELTYGRGGRITNIKVEKKP